MGKGMNIMRQVHRALARTLALSIVIYVMLTFEASSAFAQTPGPSPLGTLTTPEAVTMVLSVLLGIVTQMVQSGTFLGQWVEPKSWLPTLTVVMTFLGGVVSYLTSENLTSFTWSNLLGVVVMGLAALTGGALPGIAVFAHTVAPAQLKAHLAAAKAAKTAAKAPPAAA